MRRYFPIIYFALASTGTIGFGTNLFADDEISETRITVSAPEITSENDPSNVLPGTVDVGSEPISDRVEVISLEVQSGIPIEEIGHHARRILAETATAAGQPPISIHVILREPSRSPDLSDLNPQDKKAVQLATLIQRESGSRYFVTEPTAEFREHVDLSAVKEFDDAKDEERSVRLGFKVIRGWGAGIATFSTVIIETGSVVGATLGTWAAVYSAMGLQDVNEHYNRVLSGPAFWDRSGKLLRKIEAEDAGESTAEENVSPVWRLTYSTHRVVRHAAVISGYLTGVLVGIVAGVNIESQILEVFGVDSMPFALPSLSAFLLKTWVPGLLSASTFGLMKRNDSRLYLNKMETLYIRHNGDDEKVLKEEKTKLITDTQRLTAKLSIATILTEMLARSSIEALTWTGRAGMGLAWVVGGFQHYYHFKGGKNSPTAVWIAEMAAKAKAKTVSIGRSLRNLCTLSFLGKNTVQQDANPDLKPE